MSHYTNLVVMCLNRQSEKSPAQITFDCIRECLQETQSINREQTSTRLMQQRGWLGRLRQLRFHKPLLSYFVFISISYPVLGIISFIVNEWTRDLDSKIQSFIRLIFLLIITFFYLAFTIGLNIITTPRFEMGYDEQWQTSLGCYLSKSKIDLDYAKPDKMREAKRRIKRAISHYSRGGEALRFMIDLMWGGIVIGCLPDKESQNALLTLLPLTIFNANPFGGFCLFFLPFLFGWYQFRYYIRIVWMQQVIDQIELEE